MSYSHLSLRDTSDDTWATDGSGEHDSRFGSARSRSQASSSALLDTTRNIASRAVSVASLVCDSCCCCCRGLWTRPIALGDIPLSRAQHSRLSTLRRSLRVPYDPSNPEHERVLRSLGQAAFGEGFEEVKSERWKEIGFQGDDPATDFRAGGLASLQHLLYFLHTQRGSFTRCVSAFNGRTLSASDVEYFLPWACSGINVSFALSQALHLRSHARSMLSPRDAELYRAFLTLLQSDEYAFEELYAACFTSLLDRWLDLRPGAPRARYMDFARHLRVVLHRVESVLLLQPPSETLREFHRRLAEYEAEGVGAEEEERIMNGETI